MAEGLLCRCSLCGREERAGEHPLSTGWPTCCGYTMTLIDTERFIETLDPEMARMFQGVKTARRLYGV